MARGIRVDTFRTLSQHAIGQSGGREHQALLLAGRLYCFGDAVIRTPGANRLKVDSQIGTKHMPPQCCGMRCT